MKHRLDADIPAGDFMERFREKLLVPLKGGEVIIVRAGNTQRAVVDVQNRADFERAADGDARALNFRDPLLPACLRFFGGNHLHGLRRLRRRDGCVGGNIRPFLYHCRLQPRRCQLARKGLPKYIRDHRGRNERRWTQHTGAHGANDFDFFFFYGNNVWWGSAGSACRK